jgi:hypothetical protein
MKKKNCNGICKYIPNEIKLTNNCSDHFRDSFMAPVIRQIRRFVKIQIQGHLHVLFMVQELKIRQVRSPYFDVII